MLDGLYGIVDTSASPRRQHLEIAEALVRGGCRTLQLRAKDTPDEGLVRVLEQLVPLCRSHGTALLVNDRLEPALAFPGVGLHLGQDDLDPRRAREQMGSTRLIGWSTHTLDQVRLAPSMEVDYIGFGPVFTAETKHLSPGDSREAGAPVGLDLLSQAVALSELPVVAIGGINLQNLAQVRETGARSVAMISAITCARDMAEATTLVQRALCN